MKNNRFRGFSDRHQAIHIIEYSQPSERGGDLIQIILSAISPAPFHPGMHGVTW
jgi:hypothetical protein